MLGGLIEGGVIEGAIEFIQPGFCGVQRVQALGSKRSAVGSSGVVHGLTRYRNVCGQPKPMRLGAADQRTREQQGTSGAFADHRTQRRNGHRWRNSQRVDRIAQSGVRGDEYEVARAQNGAAAGDGCAMNARYHDLRKPTDGTKQLAHECRTLSPGDQSRINRRKKEYVKMSAKLIADVVKKYNITNIDPKLAAFALLGMLNWTYQWYQPSGSSSRDDIVRNFQQIFLQGILGHVTARAATEHS